MVISCHFCADSYSAARPVALQVSISPLMVTPKTATWLRKLKQIWTRGRYQVRTYFNLFSFAVGWLDIWIFISKSNIWDSKTIKRCKNCEFTNRRPLRRWVSTRFVPWPSHQWDIGPGRSALFIAIKNVVDRWNQVLNSGIETSSNGPMEIM